MHEARLIAKLFIGQFSNVVISLSEFQPVTMTEELWLANVKSHELAGMTEVF